MPEYLTDLLFAMFCWWFGTGLVLFLNQLPARTYRWSLSVATAGLVAALYGLGNSRDDASSSGATYPPRMDAKHKEHLRFARELAGALLADPRVTAIGMYVEGIGDAPAFAALAQAARAAGKGVVDFAHFIGCLRAAGFDGDMVTHGLSAAEAPVVAAFLAGLVAR